MATLGGSVPRLPDDMKRMGLNRKVESVEDLLAQEPKVVTASEVEQSVKDNLPMVEAAFAKRLEGIVKKFNRGLKGVIKELKRIIKAREGKA